MDKTTLFDATAATLAIATGKTRDDITPAGRAFLAKRLEAAGGRAADQADEGASDFTDMLALLPLAVIFAAAKWRMTGRKVSLDTPFLTDVEAVMASVQTRICDDG